MARRTSIIDPPATRWCAVFAASAIVAACLCGRTAAQFQFATPQAITFDFGLAPTCVAAADLNDDGLMDMVITGRNAEFLVVVMLGAGPGRFDQPSTIEMPGHTDWVAIRDYDQDGHLDLAIAVRSLLGRVTLHFGNGDGSFDEPISYYVGRSPSCLAAEDFDEDGDIDLAVSNFGSSNVVLLRNLGDGAFDLVQDIFIGPTAVTGGAPFYLNAADLDNDGDLDLAVGNLASGDVTILANDDGTFATPVDVPVGFPTGLASGDFDLDGDVDLAFGDLTDFNGNARILENHGDAAFSGISAFETGGWTWFVAPVDLDRDGWLDLIVTEALLGRVHALRNLATGELDLGPSQHFFTGSFVRFVLPVDFDDDCAVDLILADINNDRITLLRNQTPQIGPCDPPGSGIDADINSDGLVNAADLAILLGAWGRCPAACLADLNSDALVNAADLAILLGSWVT